MSVRTSSRVLYKATARVASPSAALFRVIFFSPQKPGLAGFLERCQEPCV